MARVTRRSRDQRRQAVLEAAAERVRSGQLDWALALTFGDLSRGTGIDQGQIARDFGSKEALAVELTRFMLDLDASRQRGAVAEVWAAEIVGQDRSLADALLAWARANDRRERPDYQQLRARMMLWASAEPGSTEWEQLSHLFTSTVELYSTGIAALVEQATVNGGERRHHLSPDEFTVVMSAVIEGLMIRASVTPDLVTDDLMGRALQALFTAMVGPDGDGPAEQLDQLRLNPDPGPTSD